MHPISIVFLCRLQSIATHRDHFVRLLSVRLSVRPSVCLSVCLSVCPSVCHTRRAMFRRRHMHSSKCCHYFDYSSLIYSTVPILQAAGFVLTTLTCWSRRSSACLLSCCPRWWGQCMLGRQLYTYSRKTFSSTQPGPVSHCLIALSRLVKIWSNRSKLSVESYIW